MILVTKFSLPSPPTLLVSRERLLSMLDAAFSRPLTLLSASAGCGKTTLLSTWAHRHREAVAWLSLEVLDNDPRRFWLSLIRALRCARPEMGAHALALLQAPVPEPLKQSLTALLNELVDSNAAALPLLLILDDYHVIEEPTVHASLTFWLEHLLPHVHLVLASRVDPDLPLARFRVRGQMTELRDAELRFTREEAQDFLTACMGLSLEERDVDLLEARTEGWIASLQLAALFLQKQADPSASVHRLRGNQRFLLDYLREEILASQPPDIQNFLLHTSWLSPLSASLCNAILGRDDSARLLEQVERANLFLHPLDEHRQWYRYHTLWAQAMQHEAQFRLGAATLRSLRSKASEWYERQRMFPEAIEAALACEDFSRTVVLIGQFLDPNSFRNEYYLVRSWLRRLPEEMLQAQPDLCFQYALTLMFTSDRRSSILWTRIESLVQWAEQGFEAQGQREKLGETLQLHADLAFFQEDLTRLFALTHQAQSLLIEHSVMYPDNLLMRGFEAFLEGEVHVAWRYFLEGSRRSKNLNNHSSAFAAFLWLGEVCLEQGELRRALHYYHQALTYIDEDQEMARQQLLLETGSSEPFFFSWASRCLAQLFYERNELSDAQRHLSEVLTLPAKPENGIHVLAAATLAQARLLHACGKTQQALDQLLYEEMHVHFPWSVRAIRICLAQLQLAQGDLLAAEQWVQEKDQTDPSQSPEQEEVLPLLFQQEEALLRARVCIAQKRGGPHWKHWPSGKRKRRLRVASGAFWKFRFWRPWPVWSLKNLSRPDPLCERHYYSRIRKAISASFWMKGRRWSVC
ncbi:hypothetical protein KSC_106060 [Ktedonobacter sp. SOSP1-52]|nr:hypothetical protein KSC_106060 [Ktedonobacter sp. SOSP1-52]